MLYYTPVLVAILGNIIYHVAMKKIPSSINSAWALVLIYGLATLTSALALLVMHVKQKVVLSFDPCLLFVALGAVGVEIGYLMAYRTGWNMVYTALVVNACVCVCLYGVNVYFFHQAFHLKQAIGVVVTCCGIILILR